MFVWAFAMVAAVRGAAVWTGRAEELIADAERARQQQRHLVGHSWSHRGKYEKVKCLSRIPEASRWFSRSSRFVIGFSVLSARYGFSCWSVLVTSWSVLVSLGQQKGL